MTALGDAFFRTEYGRLVALLVRRLGVRHLEAIEDAVQVAMEKAVQAWPRTAVPDLPSAWLFRVALNHFLGEQRTRIRREAMVAEAALPVEAESAAEAFLQGDVRDHLLRMLFACCDDALSVDSQLVFALKVLCGFDVPEIAERLFVTEANVYKRLTRARQRLCELDFEPADLTLHQLNERLPAVCSILYVMFTEGYLSSTTHGALRRDLCDEALRLTAELAAHPVGATPETFALLSLMYLHRARLSAREDAAGSLLLLEEQDRTLWDASDIAEGLRWLERSAEGETFSRYHAEAGIAAEHCMASTLKETRWDRITACYELLTATSPSTLHSLGHAVALAEWRGPAAGLALLEECEPPRWLERSYLWSAVLADLHRRASHTELYAQHRAAALSAAPSSTVRAMLARRLTAGEPPIQ